MPQKLHCAVTQVIDHGERVYSVFLKPDLPAPRFRPGQFLHFALDPYVPGDFWPESRVFSIASSPQDRGTLRITYAVKGQFTSRMEAEIKVGRPAWVKLPYGDFIVDPGQDACLLAGGTGITAFTAFLAGLPESCSSHVHLFYGARCPELLIFRALVEEARRRCPRFDAAYLAEQGSDGVESMPGRIDMDFVWKSLEGPLAVSYYLAGPPEMLRSLAQELARRGVAPDHILIDAWE